MLVKIGPRPPEKHPEIYPVDRVKNWMAKICYITNNSATDRLILLKFCNRG